MKIYESYEAAVADGVEHIFKDGPNEFRGYPHGEIVREVVIEPEKSGIVREMESSPLLTAVIDELAALKKVTKEVLIASIEAKTDPAIKLDPVVVVGK